jgi:pyruvate/2-oxoglutarate dehydrogenase complex dihydrolipoamide dehydrogenase (E3) component
MDEFDLIVLGAGSAGYAAARVAATEHRARVALVDKGPLGGLCILAGCMPSKALLQSSRVAHLVEHAEAFGLEVPEWRPNFARIMARKDRLIGGFARDRREGIEQLPNTELITGEARFVGPTTIQVGDRTLSAPKVVLALGSRPLIPPVPGLQEVGYLLSDQLLTLEKLPESLMVIGGGIIALELGQFFARLGVKVTIVEAAPRLVAREDEDVSEVMARRLTREGIEIRTGVKPFHIERRGDRKAICFEGHGGTVDVIEAEEIVVATGREPAVHGLDLEVADVRLDGRRMVLNRCLQTTNPNIYAAGDVTGTSYLVHVAVAEGELAARNALMGCAPTPAPETLYISAAFTEPNIARVGLSEGEARQLGREVLVGKYLFADHGKAEILDETDGFVKLLADPRSGALLGATVVGPEGAELIHELACALTARMTVEQFLRVPHVHPTLAEIWTYPAEEILEQMRSRSLVETQLYPAGYNDLDESAALEKLERGAARLNVTRLNKPQESPQRD